MYRVRVMGPGVTGNFGSDFHDVASPDDIIEKGGLLIINAAEGASWIHGTPKGSVRRRFPAHQVIYARGVWSRITITKINTNQED